MSDKAVGDKAAPDKAVDKVVGDKAVGDKAAGGEDGLGAHAHVGRDGADKGKELAVACVAHAAVPDQLPPRWLQRPVTADRTSEGCSEQHDHCRARSDHCRKARL